MPRPTTTAVNYGNTFLAIVGPVVAAGTKTVNALGALPSSVTAAEYAGAMAPYRKATQAAIPKLLSARWPGRAKTDVRTLATDMRELDRDMSAFSGMNANDYSTITTRFTQDISTTSQSVANVRSDLGLPPLQA
jgi:hypothetical protein